MKKIKWSEFSCWGSEKEYLTNALESSWVSGGEYVEKFEQKIKCSLNLENVLTVTNGTAALQLAFYGIEIKPGDEVILPAFGFMAAANVLKLMNAKPVFVDVDADNWCMNSQLIKGKINQQTKAIVIIHNYGVVSRIKEIREIADEYNIVLIEDCAESIFSEYANQYCGTFGDVSTFSFHATKTIATGEGGLVACKDPKLFKRMKLIRSHGLSRVDKHYWHELNGNNYRLSNLLAAIGLAQLEKKDEIIIKKKLIFEAYWSALSNNSFIKLQKFESECKPIIWAIGVNLDLSQIQISRDEVMEDLKKEGIETRPGFYSPSQLNIYGHIDTNETKIADALAKNIIVLPSYTRIDNKDIEYVSHTLKEILNKNKN